MSVCAGSWNPLLFIMVCTSPQEDKVYVQHRIRENKGLVWDLLSRDNAHIYVAG